ncbi:toll/interleukin-1 receptor domain-containing protein, partial [Frankia sp. CIT1]|uniref:toll/interleukin-1 receptor domain-containing protein n=1 Tax=Frankia sp. CIT1 TaxID=2880974 RepID=UPI001EF4782F
MGDREATDPDFFVSYTGKDSAWAKWIAWTLQAAGYRVVIQAWDFGPGSNVVHEMHRALASTRRMAVVLSADYLASTSASAEWQAAWRKDPLGRERKLVVFRVEDCDPPGLLGPIAAVDLFGVDRETAQDRVVAAARFHPGPPDGEPAFPGARPA